MLPTSVVYFITAIALFFALTNIIPYRFSFKSFIIGILILIFSLFTLYSKLGQLSIFCILSIFISYLCIICRKQLKPISVIFFSLCGYICYILSDNIMAQLLLNVFHIPLEDIVGSFYLLYCLATTLITYLLTFTIGEILKKHFHISSLTLPKSTYFSLFSLLCISTIMFVFNIVIGQQAGYTPGNLTFNAVLIIVYSLITFIIFLIMIHYIQKEAKANSMLDQYRNLEHYTDELERMNLEFRSFRHDYIDILSTLSGYIENNDMTGLRHTFEETIAPLGDAMNQSVSRLSSLSHIKLPTLKSLISSKTLYAQSRNINVIFEITEDVETIPVEIVDFVRILGIFFNNATEEILSNDIPDKTLTLSIIRKEKSSIWIIKNPTHADKSILSSIYKLGYSSKGNNRGIGLHTVKTILANYNNVVHHTTIENGLFIQTLELYY